MTSMTSAVTDPVCGMQLMPDNVAFTAEYRGRTFAFCSELCKETFLATPDAYVLAWGGSSPQAGLARRIAYFSMEMAVDPNMCTYSGGLGVLAGDTLKSAADLGLPVVGVTLLNAKGYFDQTLDRVGNQCERPAAWNPRRFARLASGDQFGSAGSIARSVEVQIEGRAVQVRGWQYDVVGISGYTVPIILLDTDVEGNDPWDRELTSFLYGGDDRYRLAQEAVLGIGGMRMLQMLGHQRINRFHMNEGHAALLVLELLGNSAPPPLKWDFLGTRAECVFTTHTPVAAGHDQFPYDLVRQVLGAPLPVPVMQMLAGSDRLNLTHLAMNASRYVNGVAKRHAEVSRTMFRGQKIDSVTNGVHSRTWASPSFKALYDRHVPGWENDPASLRAVLSLPDPEIWQAHLEAKHQLSDEVARQTGSPLDCGTFTIGFARRATAYKRADLIFRDLDNLTGIARDVGPIQLVFAGKAHPRDEGGKEIIRHVFKAAEDLRGRIRVVYLENYNMSLAAWLTAGVDLWLNTPRRPLEASGTSGMKAAHNGVPSLSTMDGWWLEGHIEGITGWSIGSASADPDTNADVEDAEDLYRKLREIVVPHFYNDRDGWLMVMRHVIALNASFFNTHRMIQQYATNAYI